MPYSRGGIKLEFIRNPVGFNSKICDFIDSKEQTIFEKYDENKFELFDSTPTIGWSQIGICSKFVGFDSKICDFIDSKEQRILEKFDEN